MKLYSYHNYSTINVIFIYNIYDYMYSIMIIYSKYTYFYGWQLEHVLCHRDRCTDYSMYIFVGGMKI
jgi:hypothetical protein